MSFSNTRRSALKILAGLAGALAAPRGAQAQQINVGRPEVHNAPAAPPAAPLVRVSVHKPGGDYLDQEASVTLRNGGEVALRWAPPKVIYEASVEPGTYRIMVKADGYAEVDYSITVPRSGLTLPVYLGMEGWPSFRMGQSIVPFEPKDDFVAVAFIGNPPTEARWRPLLQQMERMGLVPYPDKVSYLTAGRSIAIFRSTDPGKSIFSGAIERPLTPDLIEDVSQLFGKENARIGMPIDIRPGHVKVLDNAYVIRFGPNLGSADVRSLACASDAVATPVSFSPNTWLFEFNERNNYRKHLDTVQQLLAKRTDVVYAEPNLIVELQNHSCPDASITHSCATIIGSGGTNDPWSNCQTSLALQGVPDAWCFLEQTVGSASRRGSSDICIATVHAEGMNQGHPDAKGSLLTYIKLCDGCADVPVNPHGTAVYGIISATPDNAKGTSGIAPGVFHTAVMLKQPWTDPTQYARTFLWLSGVDSPATFSQPPLARPADIICCSHGLADLPTARPIAHAFERLTQEGRKPSGGGTPLGTVLVYSAGNAHNNISGTQALAADPNVIAVGNTLPVDALGVEKREPDSNYGDRLDLCAQGEYAPSLLADPSQVAEDGHCAPSVPGPGAFEFKGTSAACPMVAATAALMLTVEKNLAWGDVRDLLRQTARCIDPDGGDWQNKRSYWYGSGRLDVHEAVKAAHQVGG